MVEFHTWIDNAPISFNPKYVTTIHPSQGGRGTIIRVGHSGHVHILQECYEVVRATIDAHLSK